MFRKIHYNAPVVLTYTLLSFCVLLLGVATSGESTWRLFSVYPGSLLDPLFYVRLFGYALGHQSGAHFIGNFSILLIIGPMVEEKYGSLRVLKMILLTTLVAGLVHVIFFNTRLLGASGIVYMFIVLSSFVNAQKGRIPLTFLLVACLYIGREVMDGLSATDNVSRLTHIIGGVCGAVIGFYNKRLYQS